MVVILKEKWKDLHTSGLLTIDRLEIVDAVSKNKNQAEVNGAWTTVLHILLPLAALTLLWGRQGLITRFFLQFKENYISVLHPSYHQNRLLPKWICGRYGRIFSQITPHGSRVINFWTNGSLLCSLINSAIPGACSNPHRHWNERPSHGQVLAYKYLGVTPIFNEDDLRNTYLSAKKENMFYHYLVEIQKLVEKISRREIKYSLRYLARGMGLIAGEEFKKSTFYIYPNFYAMGNDSDIVVSITGPFGTYCSRTVPAAYAQNHVEPQRLAYVSKAQHLFFRSFSIDLGTIKIPEQKSTSKDDVPIKIVTEKNRIKIEFIPQTAGMHEICIVTNGLHIVGSPFLASVVKRSSIVTEILDLDNETEISKNSYKRVKKKMISKVIDCIDEQISLYTTNVSVNKDKKVDNKNDATLPQPSSALNVEVKHTNFSHVADDPTKILQESGYLSENPLPSLFSHTNVHEKTVSLQSEQYQLSEDVYNTNSEFEPPKHAIPLERYISQEIIASIIVSPICENHIVTETTEEDGMPSVQVLQRSWKRSFSRQHAFDSNDDALEPIIDDVDKKIGSPFEKGTSGFCENTEFLPTDYRDPYTLCKSVSKPDLSTASRYCAFSKPKSIYNDIYTSQERANMGCSKKSTPKIRQSLPNISSVVNFYHTAPTEFRSKYKERQDYWRKLSSCTISLSSISTKTSPYWNNLPTKKHALKNWESLPDLSDLRERVLQESNNVCDFDTDFYNSQHAVDFRDKFLDCRKYWESLCEQTFTDSSDITSTSDFDSGCYTSLPNLIHNSQDESNQFKQYKEKRQFWEILGADCTKSTHKLKLQKTPHTGRTFSVGVLSSNCKSIIPEHEEEATVYRINVANLTDDLKEIDYMKTQYTQARNFFKSLSDANSAV